MLKGWPVQIWKQFHLGVIIDINLGRPQVKTGGYYLDYAKSQDRTIHNIIVSVLGRQKMDSLLVHVNTNILYYQLVVMWTILVLILHMCI